MSEAAITTPPADVFSRIGLAFEHLLHQSPVNGPAREEVARLATELQAMETNLPELIRAEALRLVEASEGRTHAYVDSGFQSLATALEGAEITFTPPDPPVAPAPGLPDDTTAGLDPNAGASVGGGTGGDVIEPAPAPTTGNIPAGETPPAGDASVTEAVAPSTVEGGAAPDALPPSEAPDGGAAPVGGQGQGPDTVSAAVAAGSEVPAGSEGKAEGAEAAAEPTVGVAEGSEAPAPEAAAEAAVEEPLAEG